MTRTAPSFTLVRDITGRTLRLEKNCLIEQVLYPWQSPWMASFANIRAAYKRSLARCPRYWIRIHRKEPDGRKYTLRVGFYPPRHVIGCMEFETKVFNQILKAAGVVKTKKARAVKAGR
jgi:hypothetical protein